MTDILALVTGVLGFVISLYAVISSARKTELEILRGVIAELRQKIDDLESEVEKWKLLYRGLVGWVEEQGLDPPEFD